MDHSNCDLREKKEKEGKKKKMVEQKKKSACVGLPNNAFRNEMATLLYAQVFGNSRMLIFFGS